MNVSVIREMAQVEMYNTLYTISLFFLNQFISKAASIHSHFLNETATYLLINEMSK